MCLHALQADFKLSETHTLEQQWMAYIEANQAFAAAVLNDYQDGDIVWIQDYHLMLLPEMLKRARPTIKVRRAALSLAAVRAGCSAQPILRA